MLINVRNLCSRFLLFCFLPAEIEFYCALLSVMILLDGWLHLLYSEWLSLRIIVHYIVLNIFFLFRIWSNTEKICSWTVYLFYDFQARVCNINALWIKKIRRRMLENLYSLWFLDSQYKMTQNAKSIFSVGTTFLIATFNRTFMWHLSFELRTNWKL